MNTKRRRFLRYLMGAGVMGAAACYPVFVERQIVLENHYRVRIPNLPPAFRGFRIVHLTDLHHGFLVSLSSIERIVRRVNRIPRDMVVCTGDYVHEKNGTTQIDRVWPVLAKLSAPEGVWAVLGNHDHWADTPRSLYWLARSGQNLRGKAVAVEREGQRLWFAGGGDLWEDHIAIDGLLAPIPESDCRIVLVHNPDSADTAFDGHIDLILAGHTHGGQVRIPFWGAPVLPVRNKAYGSGVVRTVKGHTMFISRGIGWAIYPVRFNCFPEIAVLELI
jgi:predicted MPP superfamily phosphohydrolase